MDQELSIIISVDACRSLNDFTDPKSGRRFQGRSNVVKFLRIEEAYPDVDWELADQMDAAEAMQNQEEVWWAAHQRERHDRVVTEERARQVTLRCGLA